MSYKHGWAALNLEMTDRVPRTEYSAEFHWDLIHKVTGINVNSLSDSQVKIRARNKFLKDWNYDFYWSILSHTQVFEGKLSSMGHAEYQSEGVDFSNDIHLLFDDPEDALRFDPWEMHGPRDKKTLIKEYNEHYKSNCDMNSEMVNMTGIYVTCMSGLIELFGWDILLCAAGIDSEGFGEVTNRYVSWIMQYFEALAECDAPVVMVHDDIVWTSGAFLHPDWYRKYIFPNYRKLFRPLIESNKKIIFTSDGNYTQFIDDIADCNVSGFVMEPMTDMQYIADKYGKTHSFVGNADTRILLSGTKDEIYAEVKRCMDIGKKHPGFFMAVGNHIPPNTPVDNALFYNEFCEKLGKR